MKKHLILATAVAATVLLAGCSAGGSGVTGTVASKSTEQECKSMSSLSRVSLVAAVPQGKGGGGSRSGGGKSKSGGSKSSKDNSKKDSKPKSKKTQKPGKSKGKSSTGCKTEYELFIKNNDGTHEEDVTQSAYDSCDVKEKYPKCTK